MKMARTKFAHRFSSCAQQTRNVGWGGCRAVWVRYEKRYVVVHASCGGGSPSSSSRNTTTTTTTTTSLVEDGEWHPTAPVLTLIVDGDADPSRLADLREIVLPRAVNALGDLAAAIATLE